MAITDANPLTAAIEAIAEGIATALVSWLDTKLSTPAIMTDVHADPVVQKELQDDLEAQIAAGGK